jgi:anti-anti-sigma factor
MQICVNEANGATRVSIAGEMTIYAAAELKEALLAAVRTGTAVEIDLADVDEFDTAGFQQLVLAQREALRDGKPFAVSRPSDAVQAVLEMYRVSTPLLTPSDCVDEVCVTTDGRRNAT